MYTSQVIYLHRKRYVKQDNGGIVHLPAAASMDSDTDKSLAASEEDEQHLDAAGPRCPLPQQIYSPQPVGLFTGGFQVENPQCDE